MDLIPIDTLYSAAVGTVASIGGVVAYGYRKIIQLEHRKVDHATLRRVINKSDVQHMLARKDMNDRLDRIYELLIAEKR